MAALTEILPTPVEGGWIQLDAPTAIPTSVTPVEGGWIQFSPPSTIPTAPATPVEGGWIVLWPHPKRGGWSVGFLKW